MLGILTTLCVAIVVDRIVVCSSVQIQGLLCRYTKLRTSMELSLRHE